MLALILNCTAPPSSVPFGAIKFNLAGNFFSSMAPNEISISVPLTSLLTSDSSTFPSKIILLISAIEAIVVPALKLLL